MKGSYFPSLDVETVALFSAFKNNLKHDHYRTIMTVMSLAMEAYWTCQASLKVESNEVFGKICRQKCFYLGEIQKTKVGKKNCKLNIKTSEKRKESIR